MRVKRVEYKKSGAPKELTIVMSVDEAGVIAKTFGAYSPAIFEEKFPGRDYISGEIYDCLVGEFFNKTWDDGVDDWYNEEKSGLR